MKISDTGIKLVKHFEGLFLKPYKCPGGYWTIGYGHLLRADNQSYWEIDEAKADELLRKDLVVAERAVGRLVTVDINQSQFDALVSFTFNLGSGALQRSTLRQKLNRGEYDDVPEQFLRWVYAGGRKLSGLVRRRLAEANLFEGG